MGPNCSPLRRRPCGRAGTEHSEAIPHFLAWVCGAAVGSAPARRLFLPRETIRSARSWCRTASHPAEYACARTCRRSPGQSGISHHFSSESARRSLSMSRRNSRNSIWGLRQRLKINFRRWVVVCAHGLSLLRLIELSLGPFRACG